LAASFANLRSNFQTLLLAAPKAVVICAVLQQALPYMTDVPAALRHWHSLLKPGGRLAFNCWAEQSYVTGHLLREIAARHGIRVAVIRRDTGTPDHCRSILGAAGFVETKVVAEPTSTFFSADQLEGALESAVTSPLYRITPSDAIRLNSEAERSMMEANLADSSNTDGVTLGASVDDLTPKTGEQIWRALNLGKRLPKTSPPISHHCVTMSQN
jgi:SAM-dependent methyltransferase